MGSEPSASGVINGDSEKGAGIAHERLTGAADLIPGAGPQAVRVRVERSASAHPARCGRARAQSRSRRTIGGCFASPRDRSCPLYALRTTQSSRSGCT